MVKNFRLLCKLSGQIARGNSRNTFQKSRIQGFENNLRFTVDFRGSKLFLYGLL
jgi:hypothetical protein